MGRTSNLDGATAQRLQEALLAAYPTRSALAQMVRFGLNQNLDVFASSDNLASAVFDLIRWAEEKGQVEALLDVALGQSDGNPELRALAEELGRPTLKSGT